MLVPPGDVAAVSRAIVELLQDEPRRAALGAGGREVAAQYSWDRIGRRLVEIYEQLAVGATSERAAA